ncbi:MAG: 50S ribosomal protein L10 [Phycisphaeraceae bacterium]
MSKPIKELITTTYRQRFDGVTGAVLVDVRGIDANNNNRLRHDLNGKGIRITVVKNTLARRAFEQNELAPLTELLDGACAVVYPSNGDATVVNVARELVKWAKELENLEFRGAVMEGAVFGPNEIDALSKYPTREEAHAQIVQLVLSPAQKLVGAITGPGQQLAGLVDAIRQKLEDGEEIRKAG